MPKGSEVMIFLKAFIIGYTRASLWSVKFKSSGIIGGNAGVSGSGGNGGSKEDNCAGLSKFVQITLVQKQGRMMINKA